MSALFLPFCGSADAETARRGALGRAGTNGWRGCDPTRAGPSSRGAERLIGESGCAGLCGSACTALGALDCDQYASTRDRKGPAQVQVAAMLCLTTPPALAATDRQRQLPCSFAAALHRLCHTTVSSRHMATKWVNSTLMHSSPAPNGAAGLRSRCRHQLHCAAAHRYTPNPLSRQR